MDAVTRWRLVGLALIVSAAALLVAGFTVDGDPATAARVAGIGVGVLGLACLRAGHWVRKSRVLTEVGRDLHVPPDESRGG